MRYVRDIGSTRTIDELIADGYRRVEWDYVKQRFDQTGMSRAAKVYQKVGWYTCAFVNVDSPC